jgi:hypothetical protein
MRNDKEWTILNESPTVAITRTAGEAMSQIWQVEMLAIPFIMPEL